jgi:hypothetical protein
MCTGHSEDKLDTQLLQILYDQFADLDFHECTTEKIFRAIVIAQRNFSHISDQYPPAPHNIIYSIYSSDYNIFRRFTIETILFELTPCACLLRCPAASLLRPQRSNGMNKIFGSRPLFPVALQVLFPHD